MVCYPWYRKDVINTIRILADPIYQKRVWLNGEYPRENYFDNFNQAIHMLFDNLGLEDVKMDQIIGYVLKDEIEYQSVLRIVNELDKVLNDVGLDGSDRDYLESKRWPNVIKKAKDAYMLLTGEEDPSGTFEFLQNE